MTDRDFRYLADLVRKISGIVLPPHKKNLVYTRLARRLRALGIPTFEEYCALLESDEAGGEIGDMINAITTNLTRFFREEHHFEHLRNAVLKPAVEQGVRRLRIWSAGCSTGEEPHSIALVMTHTLPAGRGIDAKILATDLDTEVLRKGRAGEYDASGLDSLPAEYRRNGFTAGSSPTKVRVADAARNLISFRQLNLLAEWPVKGPFDAIFCRNVMIYFDRETKAELVRRFTAKLRPGGVLYIGHSESLLDSGKELRLVGRTTYVKEA